MHSKDILVSVHSDDFTIMTPQGDRDIRQLRQRLALAWPDVNVIFCTPTTESLSDDDIEAMSWEPPTPEQVQELKKRRKQRRQEHLMRLSADDMKAAGWYRKDEQTQ